MVPLASAVNIMICGLTAAGKTTHARRLARERGLRYVSAVEAIAAISGTGKVQATDSTFWTSPDGQKLDARRRQEAWIDEQLDQELKRLSLDSVPSVFDTFGLPWISPAPAIRVWLESSYESRLLKAAVSHLGDPDVRQEDLPEVIRNKDQFIRDDFLKRYGFDIFQDRAVFDVVIDISPYIKEATFVASEASIRLSHEVLEEALGAIDSTSTS